MQYRSKKRNELGHFLTQPFLWLPFPFLIFLDVVIELYHRICFPVYGIELVVRGDYILVMDRAKLQYLKGWEKAGCMYCGYANGLLAYMVEIAGRTEQYWCGIMHEGKPGFKVQEHMVKDKFAKFGSEDDLIKKYGKSE